MRSRLFSLLLVVPLVALALRGADDPPKLPQDIQPLPRELSTRMRDLLHAAEKYRGLACHEMVPSGSLGEEILRKKMVEAFQQELPPEKLHALEASLKAFGFIKPEMDLGKYYPELLTSQVGGFYDPRKKYLVVVEREGGILGKEARKLYGNEASDRMEQTVLVHELTHALQDQHFNLQKYTINDPLSDAGAARLAVVEGDATLTMYDYFLGMPLESMPGMQEMMQKMLEDPKQIMEMSPDMPGAKEMTDAPAWFRDNLLFSYMQGFVFCIAAKQRGGQKLLDYAFTQDPPRSTEQILHPEKWLDKRDDPVEISMPDVSKFLPDFKKVGEGTLGELNIKILLREHLKNEKKAAATAAGWGGDRYAVFEKDGKVLLVWLTYWDTVKDAEKFTAAANELRQAGAFNFTQAWKDKGVLLVKGELDDLPIKFVNQLETAAIKLPDNKPIDMLAVTGKPGKPGKPADLEALTHDPNELKNDQANNRGKDLDLNKLLNDPNIQKMAEKLAQNLGNGDGKDGGNGLDIGKLLQDPQMQEMLKSMLNQERPQGKATDNGRGYVNEEMGFSIALPQSQKGWRLNPKPAIPMASVLISAPDDSVQITVANQGLPVGMPIEAMSPMIEMGPKAMLKDYKKISDGFVTTSGKKGYQLEYQGGDGDRLLHSILRVYMDGSTMVTLTAMCPSDQWTENEKAIKETLDTFKFQEKKAAAKKDPGAKAPDEKKTEPLQENL